MSFFQMRPCQGYKCVLVAICLFSHWIEAFPCRRATALIGEFLLGKKKNSFQLEIFP